MARLFRIWEKKRGERSTGSKLLGSLGEAAFFGILFIVGAVLLTFLIASQVVRDDAVLFHGFWVMLMVLLSFILIGGGGLIYTVLQLRISAERRSALAQRAVDIDLLSDALPSTKEFPHVPRDANLTNSPGVKLAYRLPVSESPAWRLLAATLFFLVWTGITTILIVVEVERLRSGSREWLSAAALLPFLAVTIWATYYLFGQIRLHTGIGPTSVEVADHPFRPGESYQIYISQAGRLAMLSLEIMLVCEEHATYRHGTDVRTETHPVYRRQLFRREHFQITPAKPFEQTCSLAMPGPVMHSFQGSHNAVQWKLLVRGEAEHWPPFERSFPIIVCPPGYAKEAEHGSAD